MKHYLKIVVKILTTSYPYGRIPLLVNYIRLVLKSFHIHRKERKAYDLSCTKEFKENILGLTVHFASYSELLNLFEEIFIHQIYAFNSPREDPLIFDCGSNIGISVLYFHKIYPLCKIVAFEPNRASYLLLAKNIADNNLPGITVLNVALSEKEGEAALYSIGKNSDSLALSLQLSPERIQKEIVSTTMISNYVKDKIDLVKMDVEGYEIEIINELICSQMIKNISQMIIEFHPKLVHIPIDKLIDTLQQNNFTCHYEKDQLHPGATEQIIRCKQITHRE